MRISLRLLQLVNALSYINIDTARLNYGRNSILKKSPAVRL